MSSREELEGLAHTRLDLCPLVAGHEGDLPLLRPLPCQWLPGGKYWELGQGVGKVGG